MGSANIEPFVEDVAPGPLPVAKVLPQGKPLVEPLSDVGLVDVSWDEAALVRINRIPGFIRKMVKKKAEAYVLQQRETVVKVHHLEEMTARRFGGKPRAGSWRGSAAVWREGLRVACGRCSRPEYARCA